ncbi:MAG TPA: MotE family protein [Alphaproteobacteria bacterium]|nr:MotE family protein [Alphaproteobacteria bacterium]
MTRLRLLPVVIVATFALLLLKGVGILTGGGYVLVGPSVTRAESGGGHAEAGAPTLALPAEPTMTDTSPTLSDHAPTLPLKPDAAAAGEGGHGTEAAGEGGHGTGTESEGGHGTEAANDHAAAAEAEAAPVEAGHGDEQVADTACPPEEPAEAAEGSADAHGQVVDGFDFVKARPKCVVDPGVNEAGDALPLIKDGAGNVVPLASVDGTMESEDAILERLSDRRAELDQREAELEMRMALVEAAEKRIAERTAALEQLEARINAMVDEKRTLEEAQFTALVAMYETMKPKDAAAIFDQLEIPVLLRVARAINPRKMAPILARMDPKKARDLTAGLAVDQVEPTIELGQEDLAALPQIVGQ